MNQPNKYPHTKPNMHLPQTVFNHHALRNNPAVIPIMPHAYICQGVQGPWPRKKFDTIAATAPTMKPDSAPNTMPAIMIINEVGCTLGKPAKGTRPTAAIAASMASNTTSRPATSLHSKRAKNGSIIHAIMMKLNSK